MIEPIYMLNIFSDISDIKTDRCYTHYIIDNSNAEAPKRIGLFKQDELPNYHQDKTLSPAEKRVISLIAEGKNQ